MILALVFGILLLALGSGSAVETFVMAILGAFGTVIVQGIKKYSGTNGNKALTLTVIISAALALIGAFVTNAFSDAEGAASLVSIVNGIFIVFGVATLSYKYLLSNDAATK